MILLKTIERAELEDYLGYLGNLYEQSFSKLVWKSFGRDILEKPDVRAFVAWKDGELVGMRLGYAKSTFAWHVWFLIIEGKCRRQGIGTKLIEFGNARLKELGYRRVTAVRSENFSEASALQEKMGYLKGTKEWLRELV